MWQGCSRSGLLANQPFLHWRLFCIRTHLVSHRKNQKCHWENQKPDHSKMQLQLGSPAFVLSLSTSLAKSRTEAATDGLTSYPQFCVCHLEGLQSVDAVGWGVEVDVVVPRVAVAVPQVLVRTLVPLVVRRQLAVNLVCGSLRFSCFPFSF